MTFASPHSDAALMRSTIDWWALAGVDQLIDEVPSGWLKRREVAPKPVAAVPEIAPTPTTLDGLVAFLNQDPSLQQAGPPERRIAASGNPNADLMVVIDMPEMTDHSAGRLISGDAGELFEKMLAALNLTRDTCYIAAICPGRPAGGVLPDSAMPRLATLARDHIAMTTASRLWLMGQTVSRAILGMDFAQARNSLQNFNHNGRNKVAMVSYSPRMLLQSPQRKRAAWEDMQRLALGTDGGE
jgi:uracil-DNA glycosylase